MAFGYGNTGIATVTLMAIVTLNAIERMTLLRTVVVVVVVVVAAALLMEIVKVTTIIVIAIKVRIIIIE